MLPEFLSMLSPKMPIAQLMSAQSASYGGQSVLPSFQRKTALSFETAGIERIIKVQKVGQVW
jgi:hypothetical protein